MIQAIVVIFGIVVGGVGVVLWLFFGCAKSVPPKGDGL
jgi:hypothetical protein